MYSRDNFVRLIVWVIMEVKTKTYSDSLKGGDEKGT